MSAPIPPSEDLASGQPAGAGRPLDHLALLEAECAALAAALERADPTAPVPGCPDWTARDLGVHVLGVQRFWTGVVEDRTPDRVERSQIVPDPPATPEELVSAVREASARLVAALGATPAETPVWTFSSRKTAGFVRRRQCHETLIHRIDAEQAAGRRTPVDARLAADGVDEMVRVLYGDLPDGWTFMPVPGLVIELAATDTGDRWVVAMGDGLAVLPHGGWDRRPRLAVLAVDGAPEPWQTPTARLSGTAEALDRWFWHRTALADTSTPDDGVIAEGDEDVHAALGRLLAQGIRQ